jgi:competence protein ComEA
MKTCAPNHCEVDVQGPPPRHGSDNRGASLPATIAVLLVALILSALITSVVLIASDRLDRPSLIVSDMSLPTIVVQVDGAVATPGTFRLPGGARLDDLVSAAGGFTAEADLTALNLAARVGDGEVVRIPARSTAAPTTEPAGTAAATTRVNLNTATADERTDLPGIGPVLSERIVAWRDQNVPFTSLDQIVEVEGI